VIVVVAASALVAQSKNLKIISLVGLNPLQE
jgi:hypothetical protein